MAKKKSKYANGRVHAYTGPLARQSEVVTKVDKDGFYYGVNPDGSIAWQENRKDRPKAQGARLGLTAKQGFEVYDKDGHPYVIPYDPKMLKHHQRFWPYTEEVSLEICRRISEGESLKAVCSSEGMPPLYVMHKWRVEHPEFAALMQEARKIRAEIFHDEIMHEARVVDEDTAKSSKVRIDAYKHLAAVGDPESFGARQKIVGDSSAPLNFVFNTGINRTDASESQKIEANAPDDRTILLQSGKDAQVLDVEGDESDD